MPFLNTVRLPLIAAALVALLAACAGAPPTTPDAATPTAAMAAPRIPEQVSNPAWEADMRRFEAADAQSPPPRGAVLFIGSSSIRFWDTPASSASARSRTPSTACACGRIQKRSLAMASNVSLATSTAVTLAEAMAFSTIAPPSAAARERVGSSCGRLRCDLAMPVATHDGHSTEQPT